MPGESDDHDADDVDGRRGDEHTEAPRTRTFQPGGGQQQRTAAQEGHEHERRVHDLAVDELECLDELPVGQAVESGITPIQ